MDHSTPLAGALCLALLASSAAAQETKNALPPLPTSAWEVTLGDKDVGGEEVAPLEELEEGGWRQVSRGEYRITAQPFVYEAHLTTDGRGRLRSYRLDSETHQLEATREGDTVRLSGEIVGHPQEREVQVAGEEPVVCLDNLVLAHYDLLGRAALGRDAPFALKAVVPQAVTCLPGTFTPGAARTVRRGDEERAARAGELVVANLLVEVVYDVADGRAYAVEVPAQRLSARRRGWEVARPAAEQGPPPADAAPPPYREEEVAFASPWGQVPGTLTLPARGEGPWPGAVLLSGSGPNDRDETIGPNTPFADLAHQLAARGVASLRFDKRPYLLNQALEAAPDRVAREELLEEQAIAGLEDEYLEDGEAAVAWLRGREEVTDEAVFVLGHSLGGLVAPLVAEAREARGAILLAAPGRAFEELLHEQFVFQGEAGGLSPEEATERADKLVAPLRRIRAGEPVEAEGNLLGAPLSYWADVLAHDPATIVRAYPGPVLVLHPAEDIQVRLADYEVLKEALAARSRPGDAAHLLQGLNHLFMEVEGRSTGAEYAKPGTVDPRVAERIAAWVRGVLGR